jgi:hypothetical protein
LHALNVSEPVQLAVHAPVVRSHASFAGQSVGCVHGAHVPAAVHAGVVPPHAVHVPPPTPHLLLVLPATHEPPGTLKKGWQHPPLHAVNCPAIPQLVEQTGPPAAVRSHAWSAGQSAADVQPHASFTHAAPEPLAPQFWQLGPHATGSVSATHAKPTQHDPPLHCPLPAWPHADVHVLPGPHVGVACVHTAQFPPLAPHAVFDAPAPHCPVVPSQQPPLQPVWLAPPHAAPHVWVDVSHAWPAGQSVAALHPHERVAATHAVPVALPAQLTHVPDPPHAVSLVPGRHEPADPQQPAWHGAPGTAHVNVQSPVFTSHPALLGGQSTDPAQPHWPPPLTASHAPPLVPAAKPAVHDAHVPPLLPHAVVPVPAPQVPPVAAEQHPPLHGWAVLQLVVHACLATSHAMSGGQSAAVVHPPLPSASPPDEASFPGASAPVSALASGEVPSFGASAVASSPASWPGPPSNALVPSGIPASSFGPPPPELGVKHPASAAPSSAHAATARRACLAPIGPI